MVHGFSRPFLPPVSEVRKGGGLFLGKISLAPCKNHLPRPPKGAGWRESERRRSRRKRGLEGKEVVRGGWLVVRGSEELWFVVQELWFVVQEVRSTRRGLLVKFSFVVVVREVEVRSTRLSCC